MISLQLMVPLSNLELITALDSSKEIEITVTGRKSGRKISLPVWFVHEGEKLLLLPLKGTTTNWYRNILRTPATGVSARGVKVSGKAKPVTDPSKVKEVVEKFRERYSSGEVGRYYSNFDACVELNLD